MYVCVCMCFCDAGVYVCVRVGVCACVIVWMALTIYFNYKIIVTNIDILAIYNINNLLCWIKSYMCIKYKYLHYYNWHALNTLTCENNLFIHYNIFKFHRNLLHSIIIVRFITNLPIYIIFSNYCISVITIKNSLGREPNTNCTPQVPGTSLTNYTFSF